jgi:hypothetical protein
MFKTVQIKPKENIEKFSETNTKKVVLQQENAEIK